MTGEQLIHGDRDEALDGLRAIAALLVVFFHCGFQFSFPPFYIHGFIGVHLFFVLSGYLIARPFLARLVAAQPLPRWRRYAARRFVRIYPTYFAALVVFVGMRYASHLHQPSAGDLLRHALLVFNWGKPEEFQSINIAMWTLAIEAQFYVILPIAVWLARCCAPTRGRLSALLVGCSLTVVGLVSRGLEFAATSPEGLRFRLPFSYLDLFAAGILVAWLELTHVELFKARPALRKCLLLGGVALLYATNYWFVAAGASDWLSAPTLVLTCLYPWLICTGFSMILLAIRTRTRYVLPALMSSPLVFIGRISYSMYLFHVGIGYMLLTRLPYGVASWFGTRPFTFAIAQLGPVLIVSYVAYRAVELPSMRWGESLSLRARDPKQVTPA